jgi:hypothetical protein
MGYFTVHAFWFPKKELNCGFSRYFDVGCSFDRNAAHIFSEIKLLSLSNISEVYHVLISYKANEKV